MVDQQMATHARLMSKGLRKIKGFITNSKVLSIWINQTREKIGIAFGDNTTTSGGKAMGFYASVRVLLAKIHTIKDKDGKPIGVTIRATIKKNKVAPPLKTAEYNINFIETPEGSYPRLDIEGAVLDWLKEKKLIEANTSRYVINGKSLFRNQAIELLKSDPELMTSLTELAYDVKAIQEAAESK